MYARSYEKNCGEAEEQRALPSGYRGIAFDNENEPSAEAQAPCKDECDGAQPSAAPKSLLLSRLPFLWRLRPQEGSLLGSLFSDTEDFLLIGIFLLLLFSKEGDPICAIAILILFFSDKF